MSRTNPYKRKQRQANRTLLIFGEGMNEEMFLKHLHKLYCLDTNVAVRIKKGKGGDPVSIVLDADRVPGRFDRRIVLLDNDKAKSKIERARKTARDRGIELIENTPCLEYLFLSILDSAKDINSAECKKIFEAKYINKKKRRELCEYNKIFPKELLNKKRKTVKTLDYIIKIMEGK